MTILPVNPAENASREALHEFVAECRESSRRACRPQLVSISLTVDALDPLAVLESIFEPGEPHFYAERSAIDSAIAGAETAVAFEARGPERFREAQRWMDTVLENTIAVGDVAAPFGGPHFFAGFTFFEEAEEGEPFAPAFVFVPRWQVALAGSTTTAVANFLVAPDADLDPLVERVWRAHAKFRRFEFGQPGDVAPGHSKPIAKESPAGNRHQESPSPSRDARRTPEAGPVPWRIVETGNYRMSVARALERIRSGRLRKVVLARALDIEAEHPFHPLEMLNGLRQRFPDCFAFSFTCGRGASFIGATPERLARISQGALETEALAGSMRRGSSASEDAVLATALAHSEKDLREHREVLDDIVSRLAPLGIRPEVPTRPRVRRLANVQHLHTPIRVAVPGGIRTLDVVAALHPTPAVGGSPRAGAVRSIRELEEFRRGLYAGALGWLNARGGGEFFVGIRSALVESNRARIYAGSGIVAGSTPEKEFAETDLKFKAMLDAFRA